MRDLFASLVALVLVFAALSLATTLHYYRKRRERAAQAERSRGRRIIAELPVGEDLTLFTEDAVRFYYGSLSVDKAAVMAVRVLINGAPIATVTSTRAPQGALQPTSVDDRPDGIARDRWDVALETLEGTTLVECGAVRERVSQELARKVFDAVKADVERRNASTTPLR
ncbi:MAG: hypothetical protein FJW23_05125 [Acidimicrobiia bacterium]|nr:hypothetical protein [Acidimicrobiia bacterium]